MFYSDYLFLLSIHLNFMFDNYSLFFSFTLPFYFPLSYLQFLSSVFIPASCHISNLHNHFQLSALITSINYSQTSFYDLSLNFLSLPTYFLIFLLLLNHAYIFSYFLYLYLIHITTTILHHFFTDTK
jgi:hypothetical protein